MGGSGEWRRAVGRAYLVSTGYFSQIYHLSVGIDGYVVSAQRQRCPQTRCFSCSRHWLRGELSFHFSSCPAHRLSPMASGQPTPPGWLSSHSTTSSCTQILPVTLGLLPLMISLHPLSTRNCLSLASSTYLHSRFPPIISRSWTSFLGSISDPPFSQRM